MYKRGSKEPEADSASRHVQLSKPSEQSDLSQNA
eukprot:gene12086-10427_t